MTVTDFPRQPGTVDPRAALAGVIIRGTRLHETVTEACTAAELSWSTTEVSQLSVTVEDPDLRLWQKAQFPLGASVLYQDPATARQVLLRLASVEVNGGTAGLGGFTVKARSEGAWHLKKRRGPMVMAGASPSDFIRAECRAVSIRAVCQPTAKRTQVARDVPEQGAGSGGGQTSSSWTTFQRLAAEVGFLVFEFAGTVYFGQPKWLMGQADGQGRAGRTRVAFRRSTSDWGPRPEAFELLTAPSVTHSADAEVPVDISDLALHRSRFGEMRPGGLLQLRWTPPFDGDYLITGMTMPLMGTGNLTLSAETPVNPKPQPPETSEASSKSKPGQPGSSGGSTAGSKSALEFVKVALTQQGKAYRYGAEAAAGQASPNAFDCSELVQWALLRVGVSYPDGSAAQINAARAVPVAQALRTRGALLYRPGHIGISLGNGQSMEARNSRVGVGVFRASDIRWTRGGLVPGLRY